VGNQRRGFRKLRFEGKISGIALRESYKIPQGVTILSASAGMAEKIPNTRGITMPMVQSEVAMLGYSG
jgi:hypothetical protein